MFSWKEFLITDNGTVYVLITENTCLNINGNKRAQLR